MENNNEDTKITQLDNSDTIAIYQQDKAVIDTQIATAKHYPRNLKKALENSIFTVTLDKDTAATCTYSLPRGGKSINGPSVHLAKILAQNWGNLRVEAKVIDVGQKQITSQAVAFDLENNLAIKVEVKRSIVGSNGQRYKEDMITVTGNAANSIALRNAVLSVIPKAIVDKVYNAAKETITGDLSDENSFIKKRESVFKGFRDTHGVSEAEVLGAIGKTAIGQVTKDDLVTLIGIAQAIKDGDTTVEMAFKADKSTTPAPKVEEVAEQKEKERVMKHISNAKTLEELEQAYEYVEDLADDNEIKIAYQNKYIYLKPVAKTTKKEATDNGLL